MAEPRPAGPLSIVVAEDSTLLREGLIEILERGGHRIVGTAASADVIAAEVERCDPDLLVTDVRMPPDEGASGLKAALAIRATRPTLPIVVLSQYVAAAYVTELLREGSTAGTGYLLKQRVDDVAELLDAVAKVGAGGTVVDPSVLHAARATRRAGDPMRRLTEREHEVLGHVAQGRTNAEIAAELVVSEAAVVKHLGSIFDKLDISGRGGNRRVRAVLAYLDWSDGHLSGPA
jgi:DNA-binding NarL/FixJ family response regulator